MTRKVIDTKVVISSLATITVILVLSAYFGTLLSAKDLSYIGVPFSTENNLESAIINGAVFLGLVLLGTLLMFLIIKARRAPMLPLVMAGAVLFSFWGILEVFLDLVLQIPPEYYPLCEVLIVGIALATSVLILKPFSIVLLDALLILYGSMAGALFYAVLPPWSVTTVAALLATYDLYSVFKGPLRRILESTVGEGEGSSRLPSNLRGAVVYIGGLALGMGDVLIYSMLSPLYLLYPKPSVLRWAIVSFSLLIGFQLTLQLLKKRRFMPALPLPVTLSLLVYLLSLRLL